MPFAELAGVRLFYSDTGAGTPVLLVHGYTCDGNDWCYQVPALEKSHRVINVDLRGHGRSSVPKTGYTTKQYAADLATLVKDIGAGPVVAFGHSMGGGVVVALAVEYPELVRAIVPVDAAYGISPEARPGLDQLTASLNTPQAHEVATQFFLGSFYPEASPRHLAAWHARRLQGVPQLVLAQAFSGIFNARGSFAFRPDAEVYLKRARCPALVFRAGREDPSAVAAWERAQFQHPYSRAVAWEGTGHFLHQERPAEFNAIVTAWIEGLPA